MKRILPFPALLVLAGCAHPAPGPTIDPSLSGMIPADTIVLAGTRVEALERTPVYQKYIAKRSIPQIDRFAEETRIDPRKDLWELLYVSNGKQSALLGRGKISDESEPRIGSKGATRFGYGGVNFVGDEQRAIMLVSPTVAGIGDTAELKAMVDARDQSPGPPPALAALLKDMPAGAQFWTAYSGGPIGLPFPEAGNLSNLNQIVQSIQSGSFYLDLRTGLNGLAVGNTATEQAAKDLEGGLKALIALGRLSTPSNQPDLQRVWDGIRVTQQDRQVKLYLNEPEELVEKFVELTVGRVPAPPKSQ